MIRTVIVNKFCRMGYLICVFVFTLTFTLCGGDPGLEEGTKKVNPSGGKLGEKGGNVKKKLPPINHDFDYMLELAQGKSYDPTLGMNPLKHLDRGEGISSCEGCRFNSRYNKGGIPVGRVILRDPAQARMMMGLVPLDKRGVDWSELVWEQFGFYTSQESQNQLRSNRARVRRAQADYLNAIWERNTVKGVASLMDQVLGIGEKAMLDTTEVLLPLTGAGKTTHAMADLTGAQILHWKGMAKGYLISRGWRDQDVIEDLSTDAILDLRRTYGDELSTKISKPLVFRKVRNLLADKMDTDYAIKRTIDREMMSISSVGDEGTDMLQEISSKTAREYLENLVETAFDLEDVLNYVSKTDPTHKLALVGMLRYREGKNATAIGKMLVPDGTPVTQRKAGSRAVRNFDKLAADFFQEQGINR